MSTQSKPPLCHRLPVSLLATFLSCGLVSTTQAQTLTEDDYMPEVPVVLTATRLLQSLHDVPGAMTVIDRDTIRRSGARDVAELLRWVPGYLIGGFNGAHPVAAYHAPLDEFGVRNLVFIDGRSVYSSFFLGDTHRGMMSVLPEDIERIEVMRGANSAAYGANAMFGVINIVTRHSNDTIGQSAQVNVGSADVRDARASIGWGEWDNSHRLSVAQREDSGYANMFDDRRLRVLDWRSDWRPQADQEVMLRVGNSDLQSGYGYVDDKNPERTIYWDESFLQGEWQRHLDDGSRWKVSANVTTEQYIDSFLVGKSLIDYGAASRRVSFELQNTLPPRPGIRVMWGLGWKKDQADSLSLFGSKGSVQSQEKRLFSHLEWTPSSSWTTNFGGLLGDHSHSGVYWSPRVVVNYHLTPDQTFRVGVNRSLRTNSLFEIYGDMSVLLGNTKRQIQSPNLGIEPEVLKSRELSYLGQMKSWHLNFDVRAYDEKMDGWVNRTRTLVSQEFVNYNDFRLQGLEYQLQWSPVEGGMLQWQQNFSHLKWKNQDPENSFKRKPPVRLSTLAWLQKMNYQIDWGVFFYERGSMTWNSDNSLLHAARRLDLKITKKSLIDQGLKTEMSCILQAVNGRQTEAKQSYFLEPRVIFFFRLEH